MTHSHPIVKIPPAVCRHCGRCNCCGRPWSEIAATLDRAVRALLPFSLSMWRADHKRAPNLVEAEIAFTAFAEAHHIRAEFRAITELQLDDHNREGQQE